MSFPTIFYPGVPVSVDNNLYFVSRHTSRSIDVPCLHFSLRPIIFLNLSHIVSRNYLTNLKLSRHCCQLSYHLKIMSSIMSSLFSSSRNYFVNLKLSHQLVTYVVIYVIIYLVISKLCCHLCYQYFISPSNHQLVMSLQYRIYL